MGPLAGEVLGTPSRKEEAMGMGDRPPSYSASNSMVTSLPLKTANWLILFFHRCQVVSPDPMMSVGPSFRHHQTGKGGEGARAERNMAVGFKAVELVSLQLNIKSYNAANWSFFWFSLKSCFYISIKLLRCWCCPSWVW